MFYLYADNTQLYMPGREKYAFSNECGQILHAVLFAENKHYNEIMTSIYINTTLLHRNKTESYFLDCFVI